MSIPGHGRPRSRYTRRSSSARWRQRSRGSSRCGSSQGTGDERPKPLDGVKRAADRSLHARPARARSARRGQGLRNRRPARRGVPHSRRRAVRDAGRLPAQGRTARRRGRRWRDGDLPAARLQVRSQERPAAGKRLPRAANLSRRAGRRRRDAVLHGAGVSLRGARVALLEARLSEELAALFRRYGAEPHCCPAVREERRDCGAEVAALLDDLRRESSSVFVFSTGVGVDALFAGARNLEREEELAHAVRVGLGATVNAKSPFTTGDLLEALASLDLAGRHLVLLHYGERNLPLVAALAARGSRVRELLLYEWRLPEDLGPLRSLVAELAELRFAAVAFTSQIQARHLFQVAAELGRAEALREALRGDTLVAAVGPTCARVLEELGAPPHVVPENPKMGSMLLALAERFSRRS